MSPEPDQPFNDLPMVNTHVDEKGAFLRLVAVGIGPQLFLETDGVTRRAWLLIRTPADCAEMARRLRLAADVLDPQAVKA